MVERSLSDIERFRQQIGDFAEGLSNAQIDEQIRNISQNITGGFTGMGLFSEEGRQTVADNNQIKVNLLKRKAINDFENMQDNSNEIQAQLISQEPLPQPEQTQVPEKPNLLPILLIGGALLLA